MPFGGGGALHAGALVTEVGLRGALVPRYPGVTSALGCVMADLRHDAVQTLNAMLDTLDVAALDARMVELARAGEALLAGSGVAVAGIDHLFELDMSYLGQTHTVDVTLPVELGDEGTGITRDTVASAFAARYRREYSRPLEGIPVRVLNLRVAVIGRRPRFDLAALAPPAARDAGPPEPREHRRVRCDGAWHRAPVYERLELPVGATLDGPALLEQGDATILVDPGLVARVDRLGNLVVERADAG